MFRWLLRSISLTFPPSGSIFECEDHFFLNSFIRLNSCGMSLAVLNAEPEAKYLAKPRKVSTAVDEYGIHQAFGRIARRLTCICCGWTSSIRPSRPWVLPRPLFLKPPQGVCPIPWV